MKNLYVLTILFVIILFSAPTICQPDDSDNQIIQLATGKDKITYSVFSHEFNEPLVGAAIYSFNLKKILTTTDMDGFATLAKGVKGIIEVSADNYKSVCF